MSEPHGRPESSQDHRVDDRHISEHSRDSKVDVKPPPHSLYQSYARPGSAHNPAASAVPGIKQEANFSLYGYQPFQHTYISQEKLYSQGLTESRGVKEEVGGAMTSPAQHSKSHMATPPPLLKDHKSSVIVENKPHEAGGMPHPPPAHHAPRAPHMPLGLMARPHQGSITLGTAVSPRPNPKGLEVRPPPAHSQSLPMGSRPPIDPKLAARRSPHTTAAGYHAVGQPLVSMPPSSSGLPYGLLQPGVMSAYSQGAASHVAKMAMDVQARGSQGAAPARSSPPQAGSVPAPGSSGLPSPLAGHKRRSPTLSPAGAAAAAAAAAAKRPKTEEAMRQMGPGASQQHQYRVGSPHVAAPATQAPSTTPNGVTRTTSSGFMDSFRSFVENTVQTAFFQDSQLSKQPPRSRHKATGSPLPPSLPPATTAPASSTPSPAPRPAPATSATPPLAPHPALPQNPITMASIQRPAPSNTPGSVSSTSSIQETMNRVANGFMDTDSDTLSAPSPPPHLRADATSSPKAHNHTKFKKAWLLRYSDEDKDKPKSDTPPVTNKDATNNESCDKTDANTSTAGSQGTTTTTTTTTTNTTTTTPPLSADTKTDTQTDVKEEKDSKDTVKDCYVNCSYITGPKDRSRSPASIKDSVSEMGKSPAPKEKEAKDTEKPESKKDKAESMSSGSDTESQVSFALRPRFDVGISEWACSLHWHQCIEACCPTVEPCYNGLVHYIDISASRHVVLQ